MARAGIPFLVTEAAFLEVTANYKLRFCFLVVLQRRTEDGALSETPECHLGK